MAYVNPKSVDSPRAHWKLIEVLRNGESDGTGEHDASLAIGEWDGERRLAMRWNGGGKDPGVGNPQSRGVPTWFVFPLWMNKAILDSDVIPAAKRVLAKALMD
jgi:hypothetical protein